MTLLLDHQCPHCLKPDAFFQASQALPRPKQGINKCWSVVFSCRGCSGLVIAEVLDRQGSGQDPVAWAGKQIVPMKLNSNGGYGILRFYPAPIAIQAPADTPTRIADVFVEAKDNLARRRSETCQLLCRKTLDLATKVLLPETKDGLAKRIDRLRDNRVITPEMADWAHIVRIDGNEAAHTDSEVTLQEATELVDFTETFLLYAFTLPAMVNSRRKKGRE